jgi:hypothetical protein
MAAVETSAQPCGCDPGENHLCERHQIEHIIPATHAGWGPLAGIKDSGERITFKSGSMRDPSTGKIDWTRITYGPMMRRWAQHLTTAEAKYPDPTLGVPNFTLIENDEEYYRYKKSAFRHFMSWLLDETDEDHAAATFFNINGVEIIKDKRRAKGLDPHANTGV